MNLKKKVGQRTFADAMTETLGGPKSEAFLQRCDQLLPWADLARPLDQFFTRQAHTAGAPHWPGVMMLKCLMLQKWYNLSDPALEEQLRDRLSWRRFVGLSLMDKTPDETTFVDLRKRMAPHDLERQLVRRCLEHLTRSGLLVQGGTLVDATILEAPRPQSGRDNRGDPEASYTKKAGQVYYGYKAHVATDPRGLIIGYELDTAARHDSQHFDQLTQTETQAVFADSAYMDQEREARLRMKGVYPGIIHRRVRGQEELSPGRQLLNRIAAGVRAVVELPFAWMKGQWGHGRVRYKGRRKNASAFGLLVLAYNLKRMLNLKPLAT